MLRIGESRRVLVCSALFAGSLVAGGCGSSDSDGGTGTGGTSSASGGAEATGGGDSSTGGSDVGTGGTTGIGGAEVVQKDCAVKTAVVSAPIINFEDYDGATAADEYSTAFNALPGEPGAVYVGPYFYDDGTGTPFSGIVAGNASNYGMSVSNPAANEWGGGMGLWLGCVDATAYQGITFWVRGSTPPGTASVSLTTEDTSPPAEADPAGGGTCIASADAECAGPSAEINVTDAWTQIQLAWGDFDAGTGSAGAAVPASGDNITGIGFGANLSWIEDPANPGTWIAVEGAYELVIDDIAFY